MSETHESERQALDDGWDALRAGRWESAREHFARAVAGHGQPEAYEGLSWAAWWLDDAAALVEAREEAFRRYRESGDVSSAARMATWLAADHLDFHGAVAVASGWLDRAWRLLEPLSVGPDHGWFAFHRGFVHSVKGELDAATEQSECAAAIGRRFGIADLEMLGLALQGRMLVSRARVEEGMRCLDEASAMALGDEASIPISRAWTCCFLVTACTQILDFERAFAWCDRIAEFAERYGSRYMLGFCREEYATVHLWRGEWDAAERALAESIEALAASRQPMVGGPLVRLAELRRRQGRTAEAEELLEEAGASSSAQLCRAEMALDRDDPNQAVDLAERVLRRTDDARPLDQLPALELLVRANLGAGRLDDAAARLESLARASGTVATRPMRARVDFGRGSVCAASGDLDRARKYLEDAVDGFERCGAVYDGAVARVALARTMAASSRSADARREARAAHRCLRELGAALDAERARRVLEACDETDTHGPRQKAPVSPREKEVLALLAEGLTNREVSKRLSISEHTVHRHVTNILRKLDLPTRAAAAAYAARAGIASGGADEGPESP